MKDMTFKKTWLIETLKENRAKHREEFLKAVEGYRATVVKALEERLALIRAGKRVDLMLGFPEPTDQTGDYDRVIHMLENAEEATITLTERDYSQYVLDNWAWTNQFKITASNYLPQGA